ncbi:hypothetical protein GJ496_008385 [Pomphorhynchus laevis]|nr:hypothetical protein GJ496_008385 [Pomphorhynchus laevis]
MSSLTRTHLEHELRFHVTQIIDVTLTHNDRCYVNTVIQNAFDYLSVIRKICGLSSINDLEYKEFLLKAESLQQSNINVNEFMCDVCSKHFQTQNQMNNHFQSKKHKEMIAKSSEKSNTSTFNGSIINSSCENGSSVISSTDQVNQLKLAKGNQSSSECLFCNGAFSSLSDNLDHMSYQHGFQIPFEQYVTSMEALITYLHDKMKILNECLQCHSRRFTNLDAVRKHMLDKQHLVIDPFSDDSNMDLVEYFDIPLVNDGSSEGDNDDDMEDDIKAEEYEMSLPSGAVIGHRSLKLYYRQRFNPNRELCDIEPGCRTLLENNKKAVLQHQTHKINRNSIEAEKRYFVNLGVKANRLQRYFRQQVDF